MKKFLLTISLTIIFSFSQKSSFSYCTVSTTSGLDYIYQVSMSTIHTSNSDGYSYYNISQIGNLTSCLTSSVTVSVTYIILNAATNSQTSFVNVPYIAVWIDYNNNGVFDAAEKLGEVNATNYGSFTIYFNVPSSTQNGIKRMRIMYGYAANPGLNPCSTYYGEVEDYDVNINLNRPTVSISSNTPICAGNQLILNSGGGNSYHWTGPNSFTSNSQNTTISSATLAAAGTYSVTVTGSNLCTASSSTNVNVSGYPVVTQTSNSPLCTGATLLLNSSGGSSYSWTGPGGFTSLQQNPSVSSVTGNQAGNYIVSVTNSGGCTATATVSVVVNNAPVITSSSNSPVCAGSNLNLNVSGGAAYSWAGPNSYSSTQQNNLLTAVTTSASGNYNVVVTNANGCTASSTVPVIVNSNPVANAGSNIIVCAGGVANLNGSGGTGYSWVGPNSFISTLQNPVINSITVAANGLYTLTVTNANNCSSTSTVNIAVNPLPTILSSSNSPVCTGDDIQLNSSGGTTYTWSGPDNFSSSLQNPLITNSTTLNEGSYYVTVFDGNCTSSDSFYVLIHQPPLITAGSTSPVCIGEDVQFNSTGGNLFSWTGPNNFHSALQNPIIPFSAFQDSGQYNLTVTGVNGCTADTSIDVFINPLPDVIATENGPLCAGDSLILHASGGDTYGWTGPHNFVSSSPDTNITHSTTQSSGLYTVVASYSTGCSASFTVQVLVNALPVVNASNNSPVCIGAPLHFTGSGGNVFSWTGPAGFSSSLQSPNIIHSIAVDSGLYILSGTNNSTGCTTSDTTHVVLLPNPVVHLGNDTSFCSSTILLHSGNAGSTYLWNDSTTQADLLVSHTGNYIVIVTLPNGCFTSDTIHITIHNLPTVSLNLTFDSVCLMASPQLLDGGSPLMGIFSGDGITGNHFTPLDAGSGVHFITYTFTDSTTGCLNSAGDSVYVADCTGIQELTEGEYFSLYPNPFNSVISIDNFKSKGKLKMDLLTIDSKIIRTWSLGYQENYKLFLNDLASGVYFLLIKSEDRTGFFRIVKQD